MSNTTDLTSLPTSQNNVSYNVTEQIPNAIPPMQPPTTVPSQPPIQMQTSGPPQMNGPQMNGSENTQSQVIPQDELNKLIGGIQSASKNGLTSMPSRDIEQNTTNITNDNQVLPNYLPDQDNDYIENFNSVEDVVENYNKKERYENLFDYYFDEFNKPIIVAILCFIIQLPVTSKFLKRMIPLFFNEDGNIKLYGMIFKSILFTVLYYGLANVINN